MKTLETIILRILFFIPVLITAVLAVLVLFFKYMINYIKYGGETIAYTHKTQRKSINDVFNKLIENENPDKAREEYVKPRNPYDLNDLEDL